MIVVIKDIWAVEWQINSYINAYLSEQKPKKVETPHVKLPSLHSPNNHTSNHDEIDHVYHIWDDKQKQDYK